MTTRNCIAAMRFASGSSFTLQKSLPRTDGRRFLWPPKREAERRTAHHSCRASMRRRGRGPINGPLAFRRSSAVMRRDFSRLGLGRASWNHRMQTGGPSPAPVQRAPRSPVTRRTGRCPNRLKAKNDGLRPQEPHPLRQSASPVDVPYDERDGRRYSNPRPRCQRLFDLCRQIAGLRGAIAAARKPGRVSLRCKDSQKRSCACQSRLSVLCESLRGCAAACEFA